MAFCPSTPPSKRQRKNQNERSTKQGTEKLEDRSSASKTSPLVVFAHGAGAPSTSEWMIRWKKMLGESLGAVEVITFDYPYISSGQRKAPPKAEKLVDHHMSIVKSAIERHPGHPLILIGKSMGSRVSCMVASAEDISVSAIICLGYPLKLRNMIPLLDWLDWSDLTSIFILNIRYDGSLFIGVHSKGTNGSIRDETLLKLRVPTMFVQGSKDSLCPLDKLQVTCKKMKCINITHVVDGGDHSFKIGKKFLKLSGSNQEEAERKAVMAIVEFAYRYIKED